MSSERVTYIDSPHLAGLALAAQELKGKSASPKFINSALLPKEGRNEAVGDPFNGYRNPLEYACDRMQVSVHYQPDRRNSPQGTVAVKALDKKSGRLLVDNEWTLNVRNA
jgi:hypothetical protein